jgi:hypothetical protein
MIMKHYLITGMLLLASAALFAGEWYDPGDWFDL